MVPVIVGPTGVGKTAVAAAWSRYLPITVISADSRQVYRSLDVGTAKPSRELREQVPHLGLDVVDPGARYSAGQFARDASLWIDQTLRRRATPVVVGGTGFYVRALADGLFREPPLDPGRRQALRAWVASGGLTGPTLAHWASRLDPAFTGGGRQRAARVVEVALLTGRPLSWWQRAARAEGVMRPWYVRLTLPRALLHARIETRVREMLAAGMVDEVRRVLGRGVSPEAAGLDGVGYREVVAHLAGRLSAPDLTEAITVATRQYAKRQETWFRNQIRGAWVLDATEAPEKLANRINERWRALAD